MKKSIQILLVLLVAVAITICFSECKKDETCKVRVECFYSNDGISKDGVLPNATVVFGRTDYPPIPGETHTPSTDAQATVVTDANGVATASFKLEALLDINATGSRSVYDAMQLDTVTYEYVVLGQVKLVPGETVTKELILIKR